MIHKVLTGEGASRYLPYARRMLDRLLRIPAFRGVLVKRYALHDADIYIEANHGTKEHVIKIDSNPKVFHFEFLFPGILPKVTPADIYGSSSFLLHGYLIKAHIAKNAETGEMEIKAKCPASTYGGDEPKDVVTKQVVAPNDMGKYYHLRHTFQAQGITEPRFYPKDKKLREYQMMHSFGQTAQTYPLSTKITHAYFSSERASPFGFQHDILWDIRPTLATRSAQRGDLPGLRRPECDWYRYSSVVRLPEGRVFLHIDVTNHLHAWMVNEELIEGDSADLLASVGTATVTYYESIALPMPTWAGTYPVLAKNSPRLVSDPTADFEENGRFPWYKWEFSSDGLKVVTLAHHVEDTTTTRGAVLEYEFPNQPVLEYTDTQGVTHPRQVFAAGLVEIDTGVSLNVAPDGTVTINLKPTIKTALHPGESNRSFIGAGYAWENVEAGVAQDDLIVLEAHIYENYYDSYVCVMDVWQMAMRNETQGVELHRYTMKDTKRGPDNLVSQHVVSWCNIIGLDLKSLSIALLFRCEHRIDIGELTMSTHLHVQVFNKVDVHETLSDLSSQGVVASALFDAAMDCAPCAQPRLNVGTTTTVTGQAKNMFRYKQYDGYGMFLWTAAEMEAIWDLYTNGYELPNGGGTYIPPDTPSGSFKTGYMVYQETTYWETHSAYGSGFITHPEGHYSYNFGPFATATANCDELTSASDFKQRFFSKVVFAYDDEGVKKTHKSTMWDVVNKALGTTYKESDFYYDITLTQARVQDVQVAKFDVLWKAQELPSKQIVHGGLFDSPGYFIYGFFDSPYGLDSHNLIKPTPQAHGVFIGHKDPTKLLSQAWNV